jgi:phosphoglycolate phosphatase
LILVRRGLIFDLDGTLVDSLPGIAASLNRVLAAAGLAEHPPTAVRGFIGDGARTLVRRALPVGHDDSRVDELEAAFKQDYAHTWPHGTALFPGIRGLVAAAAAAEQPLAVLSNKPHPFTVAMVDALFPAGAFACVLGHRSGRALKPDPEGALEIAARLGLPTSDCLVIGDSTMDIETARRAGMRAVGVTWGYHDRAALAAAGADPLVESVGELAALLL